MYDKEYHVMAKNWIMQNNKAKPLFFHWKYQEKKVIT